MEKQYFPSDPYQYYNPTVYNPYQEQQHYQAPPHQAYSNIRDLWRQRERINDNIQTMGHQKWTKQGGKWIIATSEKKESRQQETISLYQPRMGSYVESREPPPSLELPSTSAGLRYSPNTLSLQLQQEQLGDTSPQRQNRQFQKFYSNFRSSFRENAPFQIKSSEHSNKRWNHKESWKKKNRHTEESTQSSSPTLSSSYYKRSKTGYPHHYQNNRNMSHLIPLSSKTQNRPAVYNNPSANERKVYFAEAKQKLEHVFRNGHPNKNKYGQTSSFKSYKNSIMEERRLQKQLKKELNSPKTQARKTPFCSSHYRPCKQEEEEEENKRSVAVSKVASKPSVSSKSDQYSKPIYSEYSFKNPIYPKYIPSYVETMEEQSVRATPRPNQGKYDKESENPLLLGDTDNVDPDFNPPIQVFKVPPRKRKNDREKTKKYSAGGDWAPRRIQMDGSIVETDPKREKAITRSLEEELLPSCWDFLYD
jgi:hypothetical protein